MDIDDVRIKLADDVGPGMPVVRAYCSFVLGGCFAVRDAKIVDGAQGLFVSMPSRKIADHCPGCNGKNSLFARYCERCGGRLADGRIRHDPDGRTRAFFDIAHPITSEFRRKLESALLSAYEAAAVANAR